LFFGWQYQSGRTEAEILLQSQLLSSLIASDPDGWQNETEVIEVILERHVHADYRQTNRLLTDDGKVVVEHRHHGVLPPPRLSRRHPVMVAGDVAGWLETEVSLRPMMLEAAWALLAALLLGSLIFVMLYTLPLKALRRALEKISFLAGHDPLTRLPNRAFFHDRLRQLLAEAERRQESIAVLCLDLDHFKDVNDTLGHAAGDLLLVQAASRLKRCLRASDTLARLGGDEFVIIQSGILLPDTAAGLAQRIIACLSEPFDLDGREAVVGCSIGIAAASGRTQVEPAQLLQNADLALYRAKAEGRGIFCFFEEEMNRRLQERKALENDLRRALALGQFQVFFQPQIELKSGMIVGVEALARWQRPGSGWVAAAEFIPLTEETGLIIRLGEWVLRAACTEAAPWRPLKIAVNLSPAQFRHPGLIGMITQVLAETGVEPDRLEIEITENILLGDVETTFATLQALKGLGIGIVMDDFGTGYSSLSYLRQFPFDKIKIDRSFIRDLEHTHEAASIVRAVVALGHSLGMRANAEGVETLRQAEILTHEGCEEVQGYYFGKPMPGAELAAFMRARPDRGPPPDLSRGRVRPLTPPSP
jgi:diguanylate cyclase (GGDEF)-like protein